MSEVTSVKRGTRIGELPLVGGHPAIDLLNTVTPRLPEPEEDHLRTPGDLLIWARRTNLAGEEELGAVAAAWEAVPGAAARALGAVTEIRGELEVALSWCLGLGPTLVETEHTLDFLARHWAAAIGRATLVPDGTNGKAARLRSGPVPALLLQDRVACSAVELLCEVDLTHLGMCDVADGGCGWFFIDISKNKTRRWCTMDDCGAQAKARRLTERRRRMRRAAASS